MALLRKDGAVIAYVLKHQQKSGEWVLSSLDSFSINEKGPNGTAEAKELARVFSSSGDCWQHYGIHGALDYGLGMSALDVIAAAYPGTRFGLFKVEIEQKTTCMAENMRYLTPNNL